MIYCYECKEMGEPESVMEYTGVTMNGFAEVINYEACPYCGSADIEEVKRCKLCGGDVVPDRTGVKDFCDDCMTEIGNELNRIFADLEKMYGEEKIKDIHNCIGDAFETWYDDKWEEVSARRNNMKGE